ncbi:hypothetical protein [Streptomyces sp. ISL-100]|uniref:hypothetical protein n=1 Tax=Streptomyces sp. ISL-100 TaxID=2819173 RepID=UPI001BE69FD9|nr:hypothetical protein [Streptomyces sp. ISL-100]MBT2401948.1 hypothetical protein [Streptomyces sp. ISL-100]
MPDIRMYTPDDPAAPVEAVEVTTGPAGNAAAGQIHIGARGRSYVPLVGPVLV